jgi:tRNA1(Val) A37 N6-methylase TrmN6
LDEIFTAGNIKVFYRVKFDGGGSSFGQDFFKVIEFLNLTPTGHVLEWCAGPGFIGFKVLDTYKIHSLTLFDINKKLNRVIAKTIQSNRLCNVNFQIGSTINKAFNSKFNLVIANPPHFSKVNDASYIKINRRRVIDINWESMNEFLLNIHQNLSDNSLVLLQMNSKGSKPEDFFDVIKRGDLILENVINSENIESLDKNMYFMVLKKA